MALSGNVHFNITPDFSDPKDTKNFGDLVEEMSERVSGFGGSLKAEHGTGRMVAPFIEMEWGKKRTKSIVASKLSLILLVSWTLM